MDTLSVTGDVPLMTTCWQRCSGNPAHQSLCLRCWQTWKLPETWECTNFSLVKPPTASFKGSLQIEGGPQTREDVTHARSPCLTSLISACLWQTESCLRVQRKPLLFCLRAFSRAVGLSPQLGTARKCWGVNNRKGNSQLLGDRSQWTNIPGFHPSKGQFWGIFYMVP